MIIIFFLLLFSYCSIEMREDRTALVPKFLHTSLYKVLVSTGSFLLFKKEKNASSQERRIMGRKREEFIPTSVFILQCDLKLSFPRQTNQK